MIQSIMKNKPQIIELTKRDYLRINLKMGKNQR